MNQRYAVKLTNQQSHIYLRPNLPPRQVISELDKKFGSDWMFMDYNKNNIKNTAIMKKGGTLSKAIKKAGSSVVKYGKPAAKNIWHGTKVAGRHIYKSAEEVAPQIYDAGEKAVKNTAKAAKGFFGEIFDYSATKLDELSKYRTLETKEAKSEFNRTLKKFRQGVLRQKGKLITSYREAIKLAMKKASNIDMQIHRDVFKGEYGMIVFDKFDIPDKDIAQYAQEIKDYHGRIWRKTASDYAETVFKNLIRVVMRGYWLDSEQWMYEKWKSFKNSGNQPALSFIWKQGKGSCPADDPRSDREGLFKAGHSKGAEKGVGVLLQCKNQPQAIRAVE